ncbi:Kelch repeat-containing protein [Pyxidicoccus sp. MSG2]|uniref:Kelch repeat-containing protein n=1 Tax=Pyxidicoccus sp. MSG2 TaxID=2996790 RepID=UPI00226E00ED|nr:kelch repeat-containing protein [Pyxidicoccus sp. MSG2]MCY1015881.1 kelch-like protein [Pyxidicoccus sp. MSG2]
MKRLAVIPSMLLLLACAACGVEAPETGAGTLDTWRAALATPAWRATGSLLSARSGATATVLPSGLVLVAGSSASTPTATAELYDPVTETWTATGAMTATRSEHTATLLNNGKVLVANGHPCCLAGTVSATAELYDPATGTWTATPVSPLARSQARDVLLASGKVLITGGAVSGSPMGPTAGVHVYDPASNAWSAAASMLGPRYRHTATRLLSGKVLVAGGTNRSGLNLATTELYDPATNTWTAGPSMKAARYYHQAMLLPSGKVLVVGGVGGTTTELYDPATNTWSYTGNLVQYHSSPRTAVLPSGKVFLVDNVGATELYDPSFSGTWSAGPTMATTGRGGASVALLRSGQVLVAGGGTTATAELYDPGTFVWNATGSLNTARCGHTATHMSFNVLVAGGSDASGPLASAEVYEPSIKSWLPVGDMTEPRTNAVAVWLNTGRVLVIGGNANSSVTTAEVFNPGPNTWTATGSLLTARTSFKATVLSSGQVLVTGGRTDGGVYVTSTELYDPATGTWSATGHLATGRINHSAIRLDDGRVLVAGGYNLVFTTLNRLASAELYDPNTGVWQTTTSLAQARSNFTLQWNGSSNGPLAIGGLMGTGSYVGQGSLATVQQFVPGANVWVSASALSTPRHDHATDALPFAGILTTGGTWKIGGANASSFLASAELYDWDFQVWRPTASMLAARSGHTLTAMPGDEALAVGCVNGAPSRFVEVYSQ